MQHKLKNKSTNEEILCTKVVVDGFDYYINSDEIIQGDYYIDFRSDGNKLEHFKEKDDWVLVGICGSKKVICCNNPSIDIPKVIDEVDELSYNWLYDNEENNPKDFPLKPMQYGFEQGYNTHAETHSLSDDEVVEFMEWYKNHLVQIYDKETKLHEIESKPRCKITSKELLQLFKEQLPKTIYYNE